jgi:hypothetical protein
MIGYPELSFIWNAHQGLQTMIIKKKIKLRNLSQDSRLS